MEQGPSRDYLEDLLLPSPETYAAETLELLFTKDIGFDAVITCRGEEFRIHRNLAAVRSPFMRVAFYGNFTEASDGRLSADEFEVEVVRQMVHYLYNGTYTAPKQKYKGNEGLTVEEIVAQAEDILWTRHRQLIDMSWLSQCLTRNASTPADIMKFHIKMHNVADYYQIESLSEYSSIHIQRLLIQEWNPEWFCDMLKLCWSEIVDDNVRELFAKKAACHAVALLDTPSFQTLDCKLRLALDYLVLRINAHKLK
ncbi:unnamed protein product [Clonostachys solani]|uniref:BTB domain-containing protein n=1 Tax=Clonostachys solani TaxID=160281 RepID=A0A9N9W505_9HYPO|nr:unnamed protein product [Clonostachys solani]